MENSKEKRSMKVVIVGSARHGKDAVAEILKKKFNVYFQSSSMAALDIFLFDVLRDKYGLDYDSKEDAFEDRVNHRDKWYDEIREFNTPYECKLAEEIMAVNDIYVGMRSSEELNMCKVNGIFDIMIGVIDPRKDKESSKSNDIDFEKESDLIIMNDGSLDDLEVKVIEVWNKALEIYENRRRNTNTKEEVRKG